MTSAMATKSGLMVVKDGKPDTVVVAPTELVEAAAKAIAAGVEVIGVALGANVYTIDRTGYVERHVQCFDAKQNKLDDLGYWVGSPLSQLIELCIKHAESSLKPVPADSDAG